MSYLTETDLRQFLGQNELAALKRDYENDGVDKLPISIRYAEDYVAARLRSSFDIETELQKTELDRSTTLLEILAHIAIWKLAATFPTVEIDGKRHYFYEMALEQLKDIEAAKILLELPEISEEIKIDTIRYGTNTDLDIKY